MTVHGWAKVPMMIVHGTIKKPMMIALDRAMMKAMNCPALGSCWPRPKRGLMGRPMMLIGRNGLKDRFGSAD